MKFPLLATPVLVLLALTLPLTAPAQTGALTAAPPSVAVSGTSEVRIAPDLIDVRLEVEAQDVSLETATGLNELRAAGVLKLLKDLGVEERDVRTDRARIESGYNIGGESPGRPARFRVRRWVDCTLRDAKLLPAVLRGVIAQGVTQAPEIGFRSSELRKYQDQVLVGAVRAAREKAVLLAGELGGRPGRALRISERAPGASCSGNSGAGSQEDRVRSGGPEASRGAADGAAATAGWISVSATVEVTFALE